MAISRVGSVAATATSVTLPAHQAGDLIIAFAYRDGLTTAPDLPSGWTNITTNGSNSNSFRMAYKLAASSSETATGFTNASKLICIVYRGVDQTTPIGVTGAASSAVGTTISYNGATLQVANGTSWVVAFAGHRSGNTSLETAAPTSTTFVVGVQNISHEAASFDTNGGVSSYAATSGLSVGGTSSGWYTVSQEIRAASAAVDAGPGSYALTGAAQGLEFDRVVGSDAEIYALNGNDTPLAIGRFINAGPGSYAVTGADAALEYASNLVILIEAGSYAVTGTDAALFCDRHIDVEAGTYTLIGVDAGLEYAQIDTPVSLSTGGGGYKRGYTAGERRARGLEWDKRDTAQDIEAWVKEAYEALNSEVSEPAVAAAVAEVVAPYRAIETPQIDWTGLVQSAEAIRRLAEIYNEHLARIEAARIREEEAAFLLMMQ